MKKLISKFVFSIFPLSFPRLRAKREAPRAKRESRYANKGGFTLIEIIVVLIIIGVLAVIALPNLFSNVSKSKGSTAVAAMDGVKVAFEACATQYNVAPGTSPCGFSTVSSLPTAIGNATNGFYFGISNTTAAQGASTGATVAVAGTPSGGNLTYSLIATDANSNIISLTRATNGVFTCSAPSSGIYASVC